ncbi:hypothetical protein [Prosthecobacter sp.]|uniref:hypothetical protein n=1 Tax=Prosthecobacter sp. TaxID=1965333 RepID=UPI0024887614|nr:hypothetical protein [Prosthecobacter sp.]MDI1310676.1 hypothetical protein [Prosthecobacter sp.]
MIYNRTAAIARFIGLLICLFSLGFTAWGTVSILSLSTHAVGWFSIPAFALLGLAAWSIHSAGEWLWSFEEGWFRLQRLLRLIQRTLILGGLACALIFRGSSFHLTSSEPASQQAPMHLL